MFGWFGAGASGHDPLQGICSLTFSVKPCPDLPSPFLPAQTLFQADVISGPWQECRCEASAALGPTFKDLKDRIPIPPCIYDPFPAGTVCSVCSGDPCPTASLPGASWPVLCVPVQSYLPLQGQSQCSSGNSPVLKTGAKHVRVFKVAHVTWAHTVTAITALLACFLILIIKPKRGHLPALQNEVG